DAAQRAFRFVMPGLVPGIHVLLALVSEEDVDGRDKPGHDELEHPLGRTIQQNGTEAMPQTIHRGIKAMIDEANAEIETLSATEAIQLTGDDNIVIVDIRDPREIERDGRIPGAFPCTRGMLEFWIDPQSPYAK